MATPTQDLNSGSVLQLPSTTDASIQHTGERSDPLCKFDFAIKSGFQIFVKQTSVKGNNSGKAKYQCKKLNGVQVFDRETPLDNLECPFFINVYGKNGVWKLTKANFAHNHAKDGVMNMISVFLVATANNFNNHVVPFALAFCLRHIIDNINRQGARLSIDDRRISSTSDLKNGKGTYTLGDWFIFQLNSAPAAIGRIKYFPASTLFALLSKTGVAWMISPFEHVCSHLAIGTMPPHNKRKKHALNFKRKIDGSSYQMKKNINLRTNRQATKTLEQVTWKSIEERVFLMALKLDGDKAGSSTTLSDSTRSDGQQEEEGVPNSQRAAVNEL
ncbi:hypothetical protein F441_07174 [Phytophthora nicotianae CJ01A1]|uniref:MULE transposase domain-containing protein n=1 Tax=Phytophthora nicotianae CJ01A1 TaxID=1317063 RepID=W2X7X5_PHYNI|nr:hypothetical protein F441_07174 [Phytophthora nicotianae CJ01A1]